MTEQEKKMAETFRQLLPRLNETEKTYTLGYLEGMAAMVKPDAPRPDQQASA